MTLVFEIRLHYFVLYYLVMFLAVVHIVTYFYVYFIMHTECLVGASEQVFNPDVWRVINAL